VKDKFI